MNQDVSLDAVVLAPEALETRTYAFAKLLAGRSGPAPAAIKELVYQGIELLRGILR